MGKYKRFTLKQRKVIEQMREYGATYQQIAYKLGVACSSVFAEVKRGSVNGIYTAEKAQEYACEQQLKKRQEPTIYKNKKLQKYIARKLNEGKSPEQIESELYQLQDMGLGTVSCETIYRAIRKGYIPGVTTEILQKNIATVQCDNSIYIPKWFVQKYSLKQGQQFEISVENNRIVLEMLKES